MANGTLYGFITLEYLMAQRIVDTSVETIQTAVRMSVEEHNRVINALMAELVMETTDYKKRYQLAGGGTLQPLDADGNPLPVKPSGVYDIAFPIKGGGTAWGTNRVVRAKMTVADEQRMTMDAMVRDATWLKQRILAALFTNTTYTYEDEEYGTLTVQPLANGDSVTYVRVNGTASADNHFYAQEAAIADAANPFPTWYAELNEHPSNNGPYVAYVPTNLVSSIVALANFVDASESGIIYGDGVTRVDVDVNTDITGANAPLAGFGNRYLGKVDGIHVVEYQSLPDNYGFVVARGASEPPLAMREYPEAALRGLFPEFANLDGNHYVSRLLRFAGFGALNRVAALAFRIGNASYAIPTGYDASALY